MPGHSLLPIVLLFFWNAELAEVKRNSYRSIWFNNHISRYYVPCKPVLSEANMGGCEYAEIGSRYKASRVKVLLWWITRKSQEAHVCEKNILRRRTFPLIIGTEFSQNRATFKTCELVSVQIALFQVADASPTNALLQVLATCCWALQRFLEVIDNAGLVVEPEEAAEGSSTLWAHVRLYAWLALYCSDRKLLLFKVRPKAHYLCHVAMSLSQTRLNFNAFHTFDEESFLGKIKSICQKTHGSTMTQRIYQRYCLCLALFLHHQRQIDKSV